MPKEIRFYRATGPYGFLSNLYVMESGFLLPEEFITDQKTGARVLFRTFKYFKDTERAYQYGKPQLQSVADWIVDAPKPHLAAVAAHGLFVFDVAPDWTVRKVPRMSMLMDYKFDLDQQYTLAMKLVETDDAILIEESNTDAFWGIGKKGNGKNMLGQVLMEKRSKLQKQIEDRKRGSVK